MDRAVSASAPVRRRRERVGIAVLNGLVMVATMNRLRREGVEGADAARTGAIERLRPRAREGAGRGASE